VLSFLALSFRFSARVTHAIHLLLALLLLFDMHRLHKWVGWGGWWGVLSGVGWLQVLGGKRCGSLQAGGAEVGRTAT